MSLVSTLVRQARMILANEDPLPTDLYAALDASGVDITELERNATHGQ